MGTCPPLGVQPRYWRHLELLVKLGITPDRDTPAVELDWLLRMHDVWTEVTSGG